MLTQTVTIPAGCTSAEFILSLRGTDPATSGFGIGIVVDSVSVSQLAVSYTPKTISEIQMTTAPSGDSPELGNFVETAGVVTAVKTGQGYWIQDGEGAWSGVYVSDNTNTPTRGDSVTVQGQVGENFGATQIENVANYTLNSAPAVIPNPFVVTSVDVQTMEEYEGVLLVVNNAECTNTNAGFGMWVINSNPSNPNDSLLVDDDLFSYTSTLVETYNITGIGHYSYSNYKLLPRDVNDIIVLGYNTIKDLNVSIYPNPATTNVTVKGLNGTVEVYTISGEKVYTNTINGTLIMNVEDYTTGIYFIKVTENNTTATYKLIVE